jgi:hypothetical protein
VGGSASSVSVPVERSAHPVRTVLLAGAIAGALDISAACGFYGLTRGVSPVRILQSVASGLLGAASFTGGAPTAALGLCLHFFIATGAATVYYLASRRLDLLTRRPAIAGPLYGVGVYFFMQYVVLPLSAVAKRPFSLSTTLTQLVIHILCVGLPIAFVVSRHSGQPGHRSL